jgi:hypothetical protein
MSADPFGPVIRDLLTRHLAAWVPDALRRSRRATFVQAYARPGHGTAEAALRALGDLAGPPRARQLTAVTLVAPEDEFLARHSTTAAALPAVVTAHAVPGDVDRLPVLLKASGAAAAPVLTYLDTRGGPPPRTDLFAAVAAGRPAELLLVCDPSARPDTDLRQRLDRLGLSLLTEVELVAGARGEGEATGATRLVFTTGHGRRLDAFKDALWAVAEHAGVRYRDPGDPEGHLLDVSPAPETGPLRRNLLDRLARLGSATVAELRHFAAERTVYRAGDAVRVLDDLLAAGLVDREPATGRLSGEVVIHARRQAGAVPPQRRTG